MRPQNKHLAKKTKGFLAEVEGFCLFELARNGAQHAPCLEIGSYCGKSAIYLAEGCRASGQHPLFSIDHHRGSEEQQFGEEYFDPDLYDSEAGYVNTLPCFMETIHQADLIDWIIPIVAKSHRIGAYWPTESLGLIFIDGGHSEEDAFLDFSTWAPCLLPGGFLCIHDIYPDPAEGGQAPYLVMQSALRSGEWDFQKQVETLGVLVKR